MNTTGPFEYEGRLYVNHHYYDKTHRRRHIRESYPRWLLKELGIELSDEQVIHHKDGNPLNNSLENLQVLGRDEHMSLHEGTGVPMYEFNCPECGDISEIPYSSYARNQLRRGHSGPYCSHHCSAIAQRRRKELI